MTHAELLDFFDDAKWFHQSRGPRYAQLCRHVETAILDGKISAGTQLPAERDIAELAGISRVTVRKAIGDLVANGFIEKQQGSGSYVKDRTREPRLEQSLSNLTSFTEYMELRGFTSTSVVLSCNLFSPTPNEMVTLGLGQDDKVARIKRLRSADNAPLAIEDSSVPADILPDPTVVRTSLYEELRKTGGAPVKAIQRIYAANLESKDSELLKLPVGTAVLQINRTGYLASGRPIEYTRGVYRSDVYDFVAELRLDSR